jgi:hypothetical protein
MQSGRLTMQSLIPVPKDLLWDYLEAPPDLLWRLQRIADYFPQYGRDCETVRLLYDHRGQLKLDDRTKLLIEEYYRAWKMH